MPVTLHVAANDGAVENIQGSEEYRGVMVLVIMDHRAAPALLQWKPWLRLVERLDLALFIDGKDNGMGPAARHRARRCRALSRQKPCHSTV